MSKQASSLRGLDSCKPIWRRPDDDVASQVIIPALQAADRFDCMVGYFGAGALRELAPGLAEYIAVGNKSFRLLASPTLSDEDEQAIARAALTPQAALSDAVSAAFQDPVALSSALSEHTSRCLAYMLASERLQMKLVYVNRAIFHLKEWLFYSGADSAVLSGSANFTGQALAANVEQLTLNRSWRGGDSQFICDDSANEFERYWTNRKLHAVAIDLPDAIRENLIARYGSATPPSRNDYLRAVELDREKRSARPNPVEGFRVPPSVQYLEGPFAHQGAAVTAWETAGRRGILAMATGSGKTITALVAAHRLFEKEKRLLVVIACPTLPLVSQWCEELRLFGLFAGMPPDATRTERLRRADEAAMNLELGLSKAEALVVTNHFLTDPAFAQLLSTAAAPVLLIADEVHNLGTEAFLRDPPAAQYRLGLSATPIRQYDPDGTDKLFTYFGPVVFEFSLSDAIGICLVPYDYHIHLVSLSSDEIETFRELSDRIRFLFAKTTRTEDEEQRLQRLLIKRRQVLETASGKIAALEHELLKGDAAVISHTLVYATDKDPEQLLAVNALLERLHIRFAQVTAEETARPLDVAGVLNEFRSGFLQVLTAKRVLDEGLNIPEIRVAYILASTTVERQWTQRRGRVLRSSPGKTSATIHDFVVLPPANMARDADTTSIVSGELRRCDEFTRLARNRSSPGGPRDVLHDIRLRWIV